MGQNKVAMKRTVSSDRPFTLYCYKGCKSDGSSRFDTISISIQYLPIPQKIIRYYSIRYRSISIDISILSYYIPILNNHLHFY